MKASACPSDWVRVVFEGWAGTRESKDSGSSGSVEVGAGVGVCELMVEERSRMRNNAEMLVFQAA